MAAQAHVNASSSPSVNIQDSEQGIYDQQNVVIYALLVLFELPPSPRGSKSKLDLDLDLNLALQN